MGCYATSAGKKLLTFGRVIVPPTVNTMYQASTKELNSSL
jgi:hypothetical protein